MKPENQGKRTKENPLTESWQAGVKTENQKARYENNTEQAEEARTGGRKMGQVHTQSWKDELATITETLGFT